MVPLFESVLRVSFPPRVRAAPEAIVTPEVEERMPVPDVARVPARMLVEPAKVFVWESVSVPAPSLTKEPLETVLVNSTGATMVRT